MASLEQEIRRYFQKRQIDYDDHSRSFSQLDFGFGSFFDNRYFSFDAKEKRRRYNTQNWPTSIPEPHFFILDDLACRKILIHAPNAGLIVRDITQRQYVFFTVVDLFLMPKTRVNRRIGPQQQKGKWLIDLRNGQHFADLADVFVAIERYLDDRERIFHQVLACYGEYVDEEIGRGGIQRRPEHWSTDVNETR